MMVHSVYSETDIFLRELISNASDACDRLRYEAIAEPELIAGEASFAIRIKPDAATHTLTIADNGIGMDHGELIGNLGTIARSGTRAFVNKLSEAKGGCGKLTAGSQADLETNPPQSRFPCRYALISLSHHPTRRSPNFLRPPN
ncbi:MAG: hypothetical protein WBX25_15050, partial [Rhodomicrobium sp.]